MSEKSLQLEKQLINQLIHQTDINLQKLWNLFDIRTPLLLYPIT